ncbi:hypothetical protein D9V37_18675 [Nocardioides mangrovicus]|uniref:DUF975 family protein n=1 Tax=Nocardioides mangrovicus TaxID=2478913 RepID=A0A3L8NY71_9ACTN|nr:hypothetical protein [Nocardioides mangrovicus]RLV48105.1 hypothetical protein D9V37_18675 [Nocardioides mangrovicus]
MSDSVPPPPPRDPGQGSTPPPPPPPAGSPYGSAPPPAGTGYGQGAEEGPYQATNAFGYAWRKFKNSPGEMLVPILVVFVVVVVLEVIIQILLRSTLLGTHSCTQTVFRQSVQTQCGPGLFVSLLGSGIGGFIVSLITQALGAGVIKDGLNVADGKPATVGEVFAWFTKPNVIVAALLVSVITAIGFVLCYLPGIVAGFLLNWTMFYVVDQNLAPMDAIRASIKFTTSHLGETLLFYILAIIAFAVGAIVCLVGLLVTAPIVVIAAAYTFRRLNGQPVSPAPN